MNIRALLQQDHRTPRVAEEGGEMQGRPAIVAVGTGLRAILGQQSYQAVLDAGHGCGADIEPRSFFEKQVRNVVVA